ncbi:MAG: tetratricopeptide repeat protein [Thermoanaerobaculia bacterium]
MTRRRTHLAALFLLLPAAQAAAAGIFERSVAGARDALVARGLGPDEVVVPFDLTPEILAWLDDHTVPGMSQDGQVKVYLRELQSPKGKGLTYDRGYTGTAQEVFSSERFNCLGFSNLFIGLARHLGLDAYYLRINRIERYGQEAGFVVASSHITAAYGPLSNRVVLEFGFEGDDAYQTGKRISDLQAIALFYTNRGTEMLRQSDLAGAELLLRTALDIHPQSPDAWLNLGVVLRRKGDVEEAEGAYHRALDHDPQLVSAYYNLSVLYRIRGDRDRARKTLEAVDRRSNRNPYTYLSLGDLSMVHGDHEDAERYYRRALKLKRDDQEIQAALGLWAVEAGDLREARRRLQKAEELEGESPRVQRLMERLQGATDSQV